MVKLLGVVSIFLFVKKPSDLYLYIILLVAYDLLGQLGMWLPAREHIRKPHLDIAYAKGILNQSFSCFCHRLPFHSTSR